MDTNITREQLEELGIFELREKAKEFGIKPANKRKAILISDILECISPNESDKRFFESQTYDGVVNTSESSEHTNNSSDGYNKGRFDIYRTQRYDYRRQYQNKGRGNIPKTFQNKDSNENNYGNYITRPMKSFPGSNGISEPEYCMTDTEEFVAAAQFEEREGVLDIMVDGYGFLRAKNYEPSDKDAYLSVQQIKRFQLRRGDYVKAKVRMSFDNKPPAVIQIVSINDNKPETVGKRTNFDDLVPVFPDERYKLEMDGVKNDLAIRSIDLIAPIGKGQRAMIVSPPKAGKTTLLKMVAKSISHNYPNSKLFVLLIDERPEEVTDMQRSINGEVIYSTFDEMPEHHTRAAELLLARAKRLVELGQDVIILMDSLTRLARAYNLTIPPTGRTLSGGIDPGALHSPKRFFGSARNIENGGSLTIIATALVDTGSKMDDVIYEEFKGTGNMEIHLDRKLSEKRIFPAIDLNRSGTRREDLLLSQKELEGIWSIRKVLNSGDVNEATELLITMLMKTSNNREFIEQISAQIAMLQKEGYAFRNQSGN